MEYEFIDYEKKNHVAKIMLNRPDVLNARNTIMRQELIEVFHHVQQDKEVRVLILTGAGNKSFCTGRDLKELKEEESVIESKQTESALKDSEVLANLNKPVIAAINGYALGGGLELALCCDVRIAVQTAKLGLPEVKRGMIPGSGGTQRLARIVGKACALEMLLTGRILLAEEALHISLINDVVTEEQLLPRAFEIAEEISANAPLATMFIKEAVTKGMDVPLDHGLSLESHMSSILETTEDRLEGVKAFTEKRFPNWKGR